MIIDEQFMRVALVRCKLDIKNAGSMVRFMGQTDVLSSREAIFMA
jgi:hypothetical protein